YRVHRALPSFPTRRSSDLGTVNARFLNVTGSLISGLASTWTSLQTGATASLNAAYSSLQTGVTASINSLSGTVNARFVSLSGSRSEEHTSELQSREKLVCR